MKPVACSLPRSEGEALAHREMNSLTVWNDMPWGDCHAEGAGREAQNGEQSGPKTAAPNLAAARLTIAHPPFAVPKPVKRTSDSGLGTWNFGLWTLDLELGTWDCFCSGSCYPL